MKALTLRPQQQRGAFELLGERDATPTLHALLEDVALTPSPSQRHTHWARLLDEQQKLSRLAMYSSMTDPRRP